MVIRFGKIVVVYAESGVMHVDHFKAPVFVARGKYQGCEVFVDGASVADAQRLVDDSAGVWASVLDNYETQIVEWIADVGAVQTGIE
ncbi:hypothetical protein IMSAGC006_02156 [Muribaculaceae bacterium]|nr:hypothetical protein IMSAGC006_02156 [Muribaculaceae bacterium]